MVNLFVGACYGTTVSTFHPSGPSMSSDARGPGVVIPSPACRRALETVVSELKGRGHEVVDMYARQFKLINLIMLTRLTPLSDPPSPYEGLRLGAQLILAEGGTSNKNVMSDHRSKPVFSS